MPKNNFIKHELLEAILDGIRSYLKSTRGCAHLGRETSATLIAGPKTSLYVEVEAKIDGQPRCFRITMKETA